MQTIEPSRQSTLRIPKPQCITSKRATSEGHHLCQYAATAGFTSVFEEMIDYIADEHVDMDAPGLGPTRFQVSSFLPSPPTHKAHVHTSPLDTSLSHGKPERMVHVVVDSQADELSQKGQPQDRWPIGERGEILQPGAWWPSTRKICVLNTI